MAYREEIVRAELKSSSDGPSPSPHYQVQVRAYSTSSFEPKELVNPKKDKCTCCPYGYHIDLDFLNFCENMSNGNTLRQLKQIKRNKKNLRKSMEFYLQQQETAGDEGLGAPPPDIVHSSDASRILNIVEYESSATNKILEEIDSSVNATIKSIDGMIDSTSTSSSSLNRLAKQMSYDSDDNYEMSPNSFSKFNTFPRKKAPLPDETSASFTAIGRTDSNGSISSLSTVSSEQCYPMSKSMQEYSAAFSSHLHSTTTTHSTTVTSTELAATMATYFPHQHQQQQDASPSQHTLSTDGQASTTISKASLEAIRESMAVSLQRMRELEEQVKTLPVLQVRISVLKEEKRLLMLQLKAKNNKLNQRSIGVGNTSISNFEKTQEQRTITTKTNVEHASIEHQLHIKQQQLLQMQQQQEQEKVQYINLQSQPVNRTVHTVAVMKQPTFVSTGVGNHSISKPYDLQPDLDSAYFSNEYLTTHSKMHTSERETIMLKQFNDIIPQVQSVPQTTSPKTTVSAVYETSISAVPQTTISTVQEVTLQSPKPATKALKPMSRTVGVGDGNVFDQTDSGLHIHEKELRTVIIGQAEAPVAKRNVGVECKVATRDVGISYMCDDIKPQMRTVGIGTDASDLSVMWSMGFKSEEIRMAIRQVLSRNVRSVGVNCHMRPMGRDVGIQYVWTKPSNLRSIGCGDYRVDDVPAPPKPAVRTRSVSCECQPTVSNKSSATNKEWTVEQGSLTDSLDVEHRFTNTERVQLLNAGTITDSKKFASDQCQTDLKIFMALDQVRNSSCNTDIASHRTIGVNTQRKPLTSSNFDMDIFSVEEKTEYKTTEKVETYSERVFSHHSSNVVQGHQTRSVSGHQFTPERGSVQQWNSSINLNSHPSYSTSSSSARSSARRTGSRSVTSSLETLSGGSNLDKSPGHITSSRSHENLYNVSRNMPQYYTEEFSTRSSSIGNSSPLLVTAKERRQTSTSSFGRGLSFDSGQGSITSSTSRDSLGSELEKVSHVYTEGGGSNSGSIDFVTIQETQLVSDKPEDIYSMRNKTVESKSLAPSTQNVSRDNTATITSESMESSTSGSFIPTDDLPKSCITKVTNETVKSEQKQGESLGSSTENVSSNSTVTITSENVERSTTGSSLSKGSSQKSTKGPITKSESSGSDIDMERSQVLRQMAESAQRSMKNFSEGPSVGGTSIVSTTKTFISNDDQTKIPSDISTFTSDGNESKMKSFQRESKTVMRVSESEMEYPQEYTISSQTVSITDANVPAEQLNKTTASISISEGADSTKKTAEFISGSDSVSALNQKREMVTDLDAVDSPLIESHPVEEKQQQQQQWHQTQQQVIVSHSNASLHSSSAESPQITLRDITETESEQNKPMWVTVNVLPERLGQTSNNTSMQEASYGSSGKEFSRIILSPVPKFSRDDDRSSPYHRSTTVTMESALGPIVSMSDFAKFEPESSGKTTKVYTKKTVMSSSTLPGHFEETTSIVTSSSPSISSPNVSTGDIVTSSDDGDVTSQAKVLRQELDSLAQNLLVSKSKGVYDNTDNSQGSAEFSKQHGAGDSCESSYSYSTQQTITSSSSAGSLGFSQDPVDAGGVSFENKHAMSYGSLNNEARFQLKSCMKRSKSEPAVKKEISFADSVQGGSETSSSDESSDSDSSDSDSGSSTSSFEEGSYDGRQGNIIYSCKDDEAIAQGIPGAKMFDQNIRETYELSEEMQLACQVLNMYLEDSTQVQSKQLNTSLNIIQQDWFRVSSHKLSLPYQVEDYLSSFNEIDKKLLKHIVNMFDANGNCTIHYAVSHSNFEIVNLLLDTGVCDVDKKNKAGYSAIMLASLAYVQTEEHQDVVRRLFSLGNVNARASEAGQTALMLCVSHGRDDMVKMLLESGAEVNCQDEDGSTALMCACEHGHSDIVKTLLAHPGCDATLTDNDGQNALAIAMETDHKDIGVVLYAHMNFSKQPVSSGLYWKRRTGSGSTSPSSNPSTPN